MRRNIQHKYIHYGIFVKDNPATPTDLADVVNVGSLSLAAKPESMATGKILQKQGKERWVLAYFFVAAFLADAFLAADFLAAAFLGAASFFVTDFFVADFLAADFLAAAFLAGFAVVVSGSA